MRRKACDEVWYWLLFIPLCIFLCFKQKHRQREREREREKVKGGEESERDELYWLYYLTIPDFRVNCKITFIDRTIISHMTTIIVISSWILILKQFLHIDEIHFAISFKIAKSFPKIKKKRGKMLLNKMATSSLDFVLCGTLLLCLFNNVIIML